jgi:hypothetical protein
MQDQIEWLVEQVTKQGRALKKLRKANGNAPVVQVNGDGANLAWQNQTVNQTARTEQIAPGFEDIAQAIVTVRKWLPALELSEEDQKEAKSIADEVLGEVTKSKPNRGKIRRALRWFKGLLAPIAIGASKGVGEGVQQLAADAIKQLDKTF